MQIGSFDFGAEDARSLNLKTPIEKDIFLDSFLTPRGFDLSEFYEGRKSFIYGQKGSEKSALLQYIRIKAELELGAVSAFYHFQSTFSSNDIQIFKASLGNLRSEQEIIIDNADLGSEGDIAIFWRLFLLAEVAKLLKRLNVQGPDSELFLKAVEVGKLIGRNKSLAKTVPALRSMSARLARDPSIELLVDFKDVSLNDLQIYLETAESALEDIYLSGTPVFCL